MSVQRFSKSNIFGYNARQIGIDLGNADSQWDILTATENPDNVTLSWPNAGGSPVSYEVSVDGAVIDVGNINSYNVPGMIIGRNYNLKVRAVYANGSKGGWSYFKTKKATGFNAATGGSITDVPNYNGTGQTWRIHTFTGNGSFNVTSAVQPFRIVVAGGGGGGGGEGHYYHRGGNGGAGRGFEYLSESLSSTSYPVVVGGGAGGGGMHSGGGRGGTSSIAGLSAAGGGGGSSGNEGGVTGSPNGPRVTSTITGSSVTYGGGGGGGGGNPGGGGGAGRVIVAYRIA